MGGVDIDRLRCVLELAADGMWEWDVAAQTVTSSRRLAIMIGLEDGERFPDASEWQAMIHPEDGALVHEAFERLMTVDGHFDCEYRLRTRRGDIRIRDRARALERDAEGRPARIMGVVTDVTALRAAEDAIRHSQRIDALGQLASGIAHDINNLLTTIAGNAALLQRRIDAEAAPLVGDILLAVDDAAHLTANLLGFSRRAACTPEPLALGSHVAGTARLLRRLLGDGVQLALRIRSEQTCVLADPGQVDQILINLVVNARDAMPRGGIVTIEVDDAEVSGPPAGGWLNARAGRHVCVSVSDQGSGIAAAVMDHLFEPFFTTKPRGAGTGLGLYTVRGLVDQFGGFVEVTSVPERGTIFRVYLPVTAAPTGRVAAASSPEWVRGSERVVLVDDDRRVLDMLVRTLEALGYQVTGFGSAEECLGAIECVAAADLLITDVVMPGIGGRALAAHLRAAAPHLRILLISGNGADLSQEPAGGHLPSLAKPFGVTHLARKLREVLTGSERRGD
jgi:PAS domain S-box-containing protein